MSSSLPRTSSADIYKFYKDAVTASMNNATFITQSFTSTGSSITRNIVGNVVVSGPSISPQQKGGTLSDGLTAKYLYDKLGKLYSIAEAFKDRIDTAYDQLEALLEEIADLKDEIGGVSSGATLELHLRPKKDEITELLDGKPSPNGPMNTDELPEEVGANS